MNVFSNISYVPRCLILAAEISTFFYHWLENHGFSLHFRKLKLTKNRDSTKGGTANGEGPKSMHLLLDAKLTEVSEQGTKLSALLRKFAGPSCRADSTSDRSTSRHRSHRNDSRSLSHGSTDDIGCLSDGEVESLLKNLVQLRHVNSYFDAGLYQLYFT